MTCVEQVPPAVVILAQPLALRAVCGVPLVRRHLQIARGLDWRRAVVVCAAAEAGGSAALAAAVGDVTAMGVEVAYLEAQQGTLPLQALRETDAPWFLVLEGHYAIEATLLQALQSVEVDAVLCDHRPDGDAPLTLQVQDGWLQAWSAGVGDATHAYAGAALLSRHTLELWAEADAASWPDSLSRLPRLRAVDVRAEDLYVAEVRRQVEPFWMAVETAADARRCKRALVRGAQKHTVDVVAWYVNRPLETALTERVADWPITPNQVSLFTSALAYVVAALLLSGRWLPAALLMLVVNVLDGVDGKLARAKALSTRLGQLEHSLDLLYEQSWYLAFTWAAYRQHGALWVWAAGSLMLLGDSFAGHVSMQFRQTMGLSLADVAPFDRAFRRFDGRRNIYTLHMWLGMLVGRPWWSVCSMALHAWVTAWVYLLRAARHLRARDRGLLPRR